MVLYVYLEAYSLGKEIKVRCNIRGACIVKITGGLKWQMQALKSDIYRVLQRHVANPSECRTQSRCSTQNAVLLLREIARDIEQNPFLALSAFFSFLY